MLGVGVAGASHAFLRSVGSRLALEPAALLVGCATSLLLLAGVRISLYSFLQPTVTANAGGSKMNPNESRAHRGMQRDLRLWWWAIAVVGFTGSVGLLLLPAMARMRSFVFAWLILFAAIGLYQRRRTWWPRQPPQSASISAVNTYRAALERQRDQQLRWPARRVPVPVGTVAATLLVGLAGWFTASRSLIDALTVPLVIAALAFALFLFTRRMTDRAATAFQRELDQLLQTRPSDND
jgi:hypothetical protein